jgi:hypothetical protein
VANPDEDMVEIVVLELAQATLLVMLEVVPFE